MGPAPEGGARGMSDQSPFPISLGRIIPRLVCLPWWTHLQRALTLPPHPPLGQEAAEAAEKPSAKKAKAPSAKKAAPPAPKEDDAAAGETDEAQGPTDETAEAKPKAKAVKVRSGPCDTRYCASGVILTRAWLVPQPRCVWQRAVFVSCASSSSVDIGELTSTHSAWLSSTTITGQEEVEASPLRTYSERHAVCSECGRRQDRLPPLKHTGAQAEGASVCLN